VRIERIAGETPWVDLRRTPSGVRFCLVALRGDVAPGGLSIFDSRLESERTAAALRAMIDGAVSTLEEGGTLALYGAPAWLLLALGQCPPAFELRHWIAVGCRTIGGTAHKGLALLQRKSASLAANTVRIPHALCSACGEMLRDWGGRRARMHEEGTRLSDVWLDLAAGFDDPAPVAVVERLGSLLVGDGDRSIVAVMPELRTAPAPRPLGLEWQRETDGLRPYLNGPVRSDCLELLRSLPPNSIDLAFADPPYNLEKEYASSRDKRATREYLGWCNAWLTEYARVVRPGGTLAVLTLPLWAAAHARFLLRHRALRFDRWIVWDALAEPKGTGLLPAHYALVLFTKGWPERPTHAITTSPRDVCRRASCVAARSRAASVPAADVWYDIPRLRHATQRAGNHPCQLPSGLVDRLISMTTRPGAIVLDAFCGTGTTGESALSLARRPLLGDVSDEYVELTRNRLVKRQLAAGI